MLATAHQGSLIVESSGLKNSESEILSPEEFNRRKELVGFGRNFGDAVVIYGSLGEDAKLEYELEQGDVYTGTRVTLTFNALSEKRAE